MSATLEEAYAKHSAEIETITQIQKKSVIGKLYCRFEYFLRWLHNEPMCFRWVRGEGEPVGAQVEVYHMRLHDMMEHQACGVMTGKVLLDGLRANAIEVVRFEKLDDMNGRTIIQPRWV